MLIYGKISVRTNDPVLHSQPLMGSDLQRPAKAQNGEKSGGMDRVIPAAIFAGDQALAARPLEHEWE
jgi:hypothetical protein